ncbi:uncharacterized protein G2W53_039615 [Senna tora]|uniref:Uncharacterized protein n=1 Tax=Senna tora TaxID=362788 RepID=A0A834W832_9FABA|nr:uncharacterized protein G2W53_039615 [Senna tora]
MAPSTEYSVAVFIVVYRMYVLFDNRYLEVVGPPILLKHGENKHGFSVDYASGESIIVTFARKTCTAKDAKLYAFYSDKLSSKNFTKYLMEFVIWTNPEMHNSRSNWLVHTQFRTIPGGLRFFSLKDYVIYCLPDERNAQNIPYRSHSKIIFFIKLVEQYHDFKQLRCPPELTFTVSKMCNYYLTIRSW